MSIKTVAIAVAAVLVPIIAIDAAGGGAEAYMGLLFFHVVVSGLYLPWLLTRR